LLAVGYFLLAFIRSAGFTDESVIGHAVFLFSLLPALAGGFLFSAIYTDDLNSKNLITLVGFGINKIKIIIVKVILTALFGAIIFGIVPLFHCMVYAVLGCTVTASVLTMLYALSVKYFLTTLAFAALSGIGVYGLQQTTFAVVLYVLLALNIIGSFIAIALGTFAPSLTSYLMSGITDKILFGITSGSTLILPIIQYSVYVILAIALSVLAFCKKEMEF
jgi:hypothetical protein